MVGIVFSGCVGSGGKAYYVTRYQKIKVKKSGSKCLNNGQSRINEEYFYLIADYEPSSSNPRLICKKKDDFLQNKSSSILFATTKIRGLSGKEKILAQNIPIWGYFANDNDCKNSKTNVILTKPQIYTNSAVMVDLRMKQNNANSVPLGKFKNILGTIGNIATGGLLNRVSNMIELMNNETLQTTVSDFAKLSMSDSSSIYDKTLKFDLSSNISHYIYPISLCNEECKDSNELVGEVEISLKRIKTLTQYETSKNCQVDFSKVNYLYDVAKFLNIKIDDVSLKTLLRDTSEQMDSYRKESYFKPLYKLENRLRTKLTNYDVALVLFLAMRNTKRYKTYEANVNNFQDYFYSIEESDFQSLNRREVKKIKSQITKNIKTLKREMRLFRTTIIEDYMSYFEDTNMNFAYIQAQSLVKQFSGLLNDNVNDRSSALASKFVNHTKIKNRLSILSGNGFFEGSAKNIIGLFAPKVHLDNPNSLIENFRSGLYDRSSLVKLLVNNLEKKQFGCHFDLKSRDGVLDGFTNRAEEIDGYLGDYKIISLYQDKDDSLGYNNGFMLLLFDFENKKGWPKISKISIKSVNSISKNIIKDKMLLWNPDKRCRVILNSF